jgi:hypothetical protein
MGRMTRSELVFNQLDTTFGFVTSAVAGLSCVPVLKAGVPWAVDVPRIPFVSYVHVQAVLRMALADTPAYMIGGIAPSGTGELFITQLDRFLPKVVNNFGNNIIEVYVEHSSRVPANTPGSKGFYIGAHDNVSPPAFFTPKPIQVIVAGGHGTARMWVTR